MSVFILIIAFILNFIIAIFFFRCTSAPDIKDLNILDEASSSKVSGTGTSEHGRKQVEPDGGSAQGNSKAVSTVAVKRKPRTQVAESLAKVEKLYLTGEQFNRNKSFRIYNLANCLFILH